MMDVKISDGRGSIWAIYHVKVKCVSYAPHCRCTVHDISIIDKIPERMEESLNDKKEKLRWKVILALSLAILSIVEIHNKIGV